MQTSFKFLVNAPATISADHLEVESSRTSTFLIFGFIACLLEREWELPRRKSARRLTSPCSGPTAPSTAWVTSSYPARVTFRRLLWATAFSSSLSIFLYQVAGRVIEFYQYPHVTILDEMDSPVMFFPAITMCNYNSYRKSQMRRNDIFWMAGLLGVEQGDFDDFMAALGQPTDNTKFFPSKTFNMLEFVQRTSHSIDEMLLDCRYRGRECGPENFTTVSMVPHHPPPQWLLKLLSSAVILFMMKLLVHIMLLQCFLLALFLQ